WHKGILVSARSMQRKFDNWDEDMFEHAIACICSYLTLLPGLMYKRDESLVPHRLEELNWIKSLWNALIRAEYKKTGNDDEHYWQRIDQQLAVFIAMDASNPRDLVDNGFGK